MSDATPQGPQGWRSLFKFVPKEPVRAIGLEGIARLVEARLRQDSAAPVPSGLDPDQAAAVVGLIDALQRYSEAVVKLGSLVVAKCGVQLRAHRLTEEEAEHLLRHPEILDSAAALIALIDNLQAGRELPPDDRRQGRHRRL